MALSFDGVNDKVGLGDINAIDGAAAFTLGCWVNIATLGPSTNRRIIFRKGGSGTAPTFATGQTASDGVIAVVDSGNFGTCPAGTLATNQWMHLAYVFNGGGAANADRLKVYKNAAPITLAFTGTIPATLPSSASPLEFGELYDNWYHGLIACPKAWLAALTAAELAWEMHSHRHHREANKLIIAPWDDSTQARDYSGNGHHGTVTEALQVGGPPILF